MLSPAELRAHANRLPRVSLAHLPTPLEELPRFSQAIGGPIVWIKRDDCTGLALGGNKTRHNEFLLGDALQKQADILVWGAGVQSNNCRQTAAGCAKLGLDCHLVLSRVEGPEEIQGNLLIDHLVGATVEIVDAPIGPDLDALIAERAARFRESGRKVYFWDRDVVKPLAAISYAICMAELVEQFSHAGIRPSTIYACSAGSTGAGMVLGKAALGMEQAVRLIAPIRWPWDHGEDMAWQANAAAELMGLSTRIEPKEIDSDGSHLGPGYGLPSDEGQEAIRLLARTEGILLDPVYTGKALAALIADVKAGRMPSDRPVVFVHTGGVPAIFAFREAMLRGDERVRQQRLEALRQDIRVAADEVARGEYGPLDVEAIKARGRENLARKRTQSD